MLGMVAPASVTNSYDWALELIQKSASTDSDPNALNNVSGKVEFSGDKQLLWCVHATKWKSINTSSCTGVPDVLPLIRANSLLLERYMASLHYNAFIQTPSFTAAVGSPMINAQMLLDAYLIETSKQAPGDALELWIRNMTVLKNALASQSSLITHSIIMVMYSDLQKTLPSILSHDASLAGRYESQLLNVLAPFGAKDMNIALCMKADYQFVRPLLEQLDNHSRNKFYRFNQDWIAAWNAPLTQREQKWADMEARYRHFIKLEDWQHPANGVMVNLVIGGILVGRELDTAMDRMDAQSRLLNLYVQMQTANVPPDGVEAFLKASPAELYDPFTGQPFRYDASEKLVYFTMPNQSDKQGLLLN